MNLELFKRTFQTNLFGAVSIVERFLPLIEHYDGARIVNVSSTMGSLADQLNPDSPYYGVVVPAYQGSKAALDAFTDTRSPRAFGTLRSRSTRCVQASWGPISEARRTGRRHR